MELVDNLCWWSGRSFSNELKSEWRSQSFSSARADTREEMRSDVPQRAEIPEKT